MNLIKINLNQTVSKAQLDFINEEKARWQIFGMVCTLLLSTIVWFFIINSRLNHIISDREETIENIIVKTNNLHSKGKINLSKQDILNLYTVEKNRVFWSEKLMALSKITPDDMAITRLEFKNKKLNISAVSNLGLDQKEFTVVENFMKKIDENHEFNENFTDIKFDNLDKEFTKGVELLSFKVEAKLK